MAADYDIQLSVLTAGLIDREVEGLAVLTQYNPHGIFLAPVLANRISILFRRRMKESEGGAA